MSAPARVSLVRKVWSRWMVVRVPLRVAEGAVSGHYADSWHPTYPAAVARAEALQRQQWQQDRSR